MVVGGLAAACTTTKTSTLGPYVRDVRPAVYGIEVETCAIEYEHSTDHVDGWDVLGWLFDHDTKDDEHSHLAERDCRRWLASTLETP